MAASPPIPNDIQHNPDPVNVIVSRLNDQWAFNLPIRDHTWTPSRMELTPSQRCVGLIKRLYWKTKDHPTDSIWGVIEEFESCAGPSNYHGRFRLLMSLLEGLLDKIMPTTAPSPSAKRHAIDDANSTAQSPSRRARTGPCNDLIGRSTGTSSPNFSSDLPQRIPKSPNFQKNTASDHIGFPQLQQEEIDETHLCYKTGFPRSRVLSTKFNNITGSTSSTAVAPFTLAFRTRISEHSLNINNNRLSLLATNQPQRPGTFVTTPSSKSSEFLTSSFHSDLTEVDSSVWSGNGEPHTTPYTSFGSTLADDGSDCQTAIESDNSLLEDSSSSCPPTPTGRKHFASIENYRVRQLPSKGFFLDDARLGFGPKSFRMKHECVRIAIRNGVKAEDVYKLIHRDLDSLASLHDTIKSTTHLILPDARVSDRAWEAAASGSDDLYNVVLRAKLILSKSLKNDPFKFDLQPLKLDYSCRFERKHGWHRFLNVELPELRMKLPQPWTSQDSYLQKRLVEWLVTEHTLLGRKWRAVDIKDKSSKKSHHAGVEKPRGQIITFFAVAGEDIEPIPLEALINWFVPLQQNLGEKACKVAARLALGFSRTIPTFRFSPSQIRYLKEDMLATNISEPSEFNDEALEWPDHFDSKTVMNDGCARISFAAAKRIWALHPIGRDSLVPLPSAFQARIGSAKGVWTVAPPPEATSLKENGGVWIEITPSQKKFCPHAEDGFHDLADPERLTFEVCAYSKSLYASTLNTAFLPILVDRKVPITTILKYVTESLSLDREALLNGAKDPLYLRRWIESAYGGLDRMNHNPPWGANMPDSLQESTIQLLETGFVQTQLPLLADKVKDLVFQHLTRMLRTLKIPCARSTMAYGIADPTATLQPGQIHLIFSQPFNDNDGGRSCLADLDVLVTRHPTLRPSDIQKVSAVYEPKLSHIRDVVVFPSVGKHPLAGKLQGGDYDGDIFWICWEPDLVRPFENAPAPFITPEPKNYRIKVDKDTLGTVIGGNSGSQDMTEHDINRWLSRSFSLRSQSSQLGAATQLYRRVAYAEDNIDSPEARALAGLHDLLVDAAKNGYSYDEKSYKAYLKYDLRLKYQPGLPAYESHIKAVFGPGANSQSAKNLLRNGIQSENLVTSRGHVLDRLYFEIVLPHMKETFLQTECLLSENLTVVDSSLTHFFHYWNSSNDLTIRQELVNLRSQLENLHTLWRDIWRENEKNPLDPLTLSARKNACRRKFCQIRPLNKTSLRLKDWTTECLLGQPTHWSLLKASALWHIYHEGQTAIHWARGERDKHRGIFVFWVAGPELMHMKAYSQGPTRTLTHPMWTTLKTRKLEPALMPRNGVLHGPVEDSEEEWESALETVADGEWEDDDREL